MERYKYLIVGGGMTADAAVSGIREADTAGAIGLLGSEENAPYNRPPLSKGLWKGEDPDRIWRGTEKQGVTLHHGRKAVALDSTDKNVTDDQGTASPTPNTAQGPAAGAAEWRMAMPTSAIDGLGACDFRAA